MRLLLLSTGGNPFLAHAREELTDFLQGRRRIGFVTAASLDDEVAYFAKARSALEPFCARVDQIRWDRPRVTLGKLDAIMVGGGNTWALLRRLGTSGLLPRIRDAVRSGLPYVGASAGTNITGPNIVTTNDWNVVECRRFRSMGLVPWNFNPHYLDGPDPRAPRRETTVQRAAEYHATHGNPVVGIEEEAMIRVDGTHAVVRGSGRVMYIAQGAEPQWYQPEAELPFIEPMKRSSPAPYAAG